MDLLALLLNAFVVALICTRYSLLLKFLVNTMAVSDLCFYIPTPMQYSHVNYELRAFLEKTPQS